MEESKLMNKAGEEAIRAGRVKVWLTEAAAATFFIQKTADGG